MRTVIMVSQQGHCLNDLLFRWKSGLLPLDIRAIVSNHRDFYQLAASYNVPFHHIPVTAATKARWSSASSKSCRPKMPSWWCWRATCKF
jgi:formyltetrahydrofolate deformylase